MKEKRITTEQAKAFSEAMKTLMSVEDEAVERLEKANVSSFVCSNYRQAVLGASYIVKYVRDFAGSSATAEIETTIQRLLESASPIDAVTADKSSHVRKKKTRE